MNSSMVKTVFATAGCVLQLSLMAKDKPHVLWIVTDDHRADSIAAYNKSEFGTHNSPLGYVMSPEADKLASEGVLFTRAYTNSPACAPSRASMHTGKYPFHNGIYGFEQSHDQADCYTPGIPQTLRKNGYSTARFGKGGYYIFNWEGKLTWNEVDMYDIAVDKKRDLGRKGRTDYHHEGKANNRQVNWYYPDGSSKKLRFPLNKPEIKDKADAELAKIYEEQEVLLAYKRDQSGMIFGGESAMPAEKTMDGNIVRVFMEGLDKQFESAPDKPFMAHLGFHFPHTPVLPSKKYRDIFKAKSKEVPYQIPDFTKAEYKKLPAQLKKLTDKMNFHEMDKEDKLRAIRDYYAFCAMGDSLVGKAVDAFKEFCSKTKREYIIVYVVGDHGWHLGEQGIEAKFAPWDTSNRGAMIVVSSDKKAYPEGKVYKDFVEYVDIAPTIFDAADVKKQDYLDGYSLRKIISGKAVKRDYVLAEMDHVYGPRAYIRSRDFAFSMKTRKRTSKASPKNKPNKDIKWALTTSAKQVEMCLYDLRKDPMERNNVAYDKKYAKLADFFRQKLGNIVLGDGRLECNWKVKNDYNISTFAEGSDDKKLKIPKKIIPRHRKRR